MGPLEITGIITIIFVGGVVIAAVIIMVPMLKLIKKLNQVSAKIDGDVLPAVDRLNESTGKLKEGISSLDNARERIGKLLSEVNETVNEAKKLKKSSLGGLIGASFKILSSFRKGRKDEGKQ
ncbi:MAG: hypothetical protein ACQEP5_00050 [Actinomycetota bacterium]